VGLVFLRHWTSTHGDESLSIDYDLRIPAVWCGYGGLAGVVKVAWRVAAVVYIQTASLEVRMIYRRVSRCVRLARENLLSNLASSYRTHC